MIPTQGQVEAWVSTYSSGVTAIAGLTSENPNEPAYSTVVTYSKRLVWQCGRCGDLSQRKITKSHFNSAGCIVVDTVAELKESGYEQLKESAVGDEFTDVNGWVRPAYAYLAGSQHMVLEEFGLRRAGWGRWVKPELQAAVTQYLTAKVRGEKVPTISKFLEDRGLTRTKKLQPIFKSGCAKCGASVSPDSDIVRVGGVQHSFCSRHGVELNVALDGIFEKMST